jgi:predicted transcriptional regulator
MRLKRYWALQPLFQLMTHKRKLTFVTMVILFVASNLVEAGLELNLEPPPVKLIGEVGGRLDGTAWSSSELKGVVHILMYVDPDKVKINEHVEEALAKEQYPTEQIRSVAIVNLAVTWKPKFLIQNILKGKQKKYPRTINVTDKSKVLVEQWGLADHSYNVLVFGPSGNLLFNKSRALSAADVENLTAMVWSAISN